MTRTRQIAAVLAALWAIAVTYLGLTASRGVIGLPNSVAEPTQHFVSFAVMAALLLIAFPGRHWRIAAALAIAGIIGESLQLATEGRQFALSDIGVNLLGIAAGLVVIALAGDVVAITISLAVTLLLAGPFVLPVDTLPETSFPQNCAPGPPAVGGEPIVLIDDVSLSDDSGLRDISVAQIKDAIVETSEFSVEAWFETGNLEQIGPARVFTISDGINPHEMNLHIGVEGSNLSVRFRTSCEWSNRFQVEDVIEIGRLQHVVATWSGGVLEIWVDATLVDRAEVPWGDLTSWDTDFSVMIGDEVGGGRPFDGQVSSVTMWDRALDESTITERESP